MIDSDTKEGRESLKKEVAKVSSKRMVKSEELYRLILPISPVSFQTITEEQRKILKDAINDSIKMTIPEIVEYGKNNELSVRMELFLGLDRKLSDVDNLAKCLLDQMQGIVYDDDKIVRHIDILRSQVSEGQITIIISKFHSQIHTFG